MDIATALGIAGTVVSLLQGAATVEHRAESESIRQHIEERAIALRLSKGVARKWLRADIARIEVPPKAQAAKRALLSARTRWQTDISAALLEHQISGETE